jgi:hypothetical protein
MLLAGERPRLQRLLQADTGRPQAAELGDEVDDADRRDAAQTGMAVDQLLRARWAALERAEARLAAGQLRPFGPQRPGIPYERLEAFPLAEPTVDEEAAREQAERRSPRQWSAPPTARTTPAATPTGWSAARLGPSREPFQVLQDPAVQDNPLVEDDETTFDEPPPEHDPALPDDFVEDDTGRIPAPPLKAAAAASFAPTTAPYPARPASWCPEPCPPEQSCLPRWSFWRSFHRPQLNRTRPDSPESPPNLTWPDPTEP